MHVPAVRRSPLALLIVLTLLLAAVAAGCATGGCSVGLQDGTLVADGDRLAIELDGGALTTIDWDGSGHRVRRDRGRLVVTDWLGFVQAREGDAVRAGIGESDGRSWICGSFEVIGRAP
jgi:hypothetical protein